MSTVSPPPSIFSATTRVDPALPASPSKPTHGIFEHHEHGHEPMRERQEFTDDDLKMQGKVHLRHDVLCAVGEFSGSFIFLLCAFLGAQSALYNRSVGTDGLPPSRNDNETILYISLSFGMSLLCVAWMFFRITGSAFNPCVTFSLWLIGGCTFRRAVGVIIAQLLGGIAAAGVAQGLTEGEFAVGNRIAQGISVRQAFGVELFTTALLVFCVLMLAAEKSRTTFLAPVGIGMTLFIGHIASVGWTGAGINPARTLGPDVVTASFASYSWVYYLGQFTGALVATVLYIILKNLDYQAVVGEIDVDHLAECTGSNKVKLAPPIAKMVNLIPAVSMRKGLRLGTSSGGSAREAASLRREEDVGMKA